MKYIKRDVIFRAKKMVDFDRCLTYIWVASSEQGQKGHIHCTIAHFSCLFITTRSTIRRTYSYVTRVWPLIWVNKHVHTFVHVHIYSATQSILFQEWEENICIWNILHTCNIIETILIFTEIAFNVTTWNLFKKSSCVSLPNLRGIYVVTSTCLEVHFG